MKKTQSILKLIIDSFICENSFTRESSLVNEVLEIIDSNDVYSYRSLLEKEVEVNEDTLCLGLIERVGPGGSYLKPNYIKEYHKTFSDEFSVPSVKDFQQGALKELFEKAREEATSFLAEVFKTVTS